MIYIFLIILAIVWILKYAFSKFMEREYNITKSEYQKIREGIVNNNIYVIIFLIIVVFILITTKYSIYASIILLIIVSVGEFTYGLIKIKKLDKDRYTLYYIGDELISSLIMIPAIVLFMIS
ncbi:Uncharacterised protein [[Clostridium] sordellii]|uniref:hypothetical protein n=1 Tax=Paraclostridium sordellii TaxID=1505 RepID=UPI0002FE0AE0|nr:hypothetical protein [Paeniclostridium sordellii]MBS6025824.1 hypothetical protein [Paeniclostridium sordellii]TAN63965.1 hypothetical protein WS9_015140 [Paeniclostridium sordellii 8483]CEQ10648.1 Uncharacterised protein [[Clostridium] sordellii] [Paeniclostridium sordellii]